MKPESKSTIMSEIITKEMLRGKTVTVQTPGGSATLDNGFTFYETPRILSITPSSGPTTGGTVITITGTNLDGTSIIRIGAIATNITVIDSNTVTAVTPPGAPGPKMVSLVTPGGFHQLANAFTFHAPPSITSITPNAGRANGETQVTITGTNLQGTTSVNVGGVEATSVVVVNDTTITATLPGTVLES